MTNIHLINLNIVFSLTALSAIRETELSISDEPCNRTLSNYPFICLLEDAKIRLYENVFGFYQNDINPPPPLSPQYHSQYKLYAYFLYPTPHQDCKATYKWF